MANKPTLLKFGTDIQGFVAYAPVSAADKYSVTLSASTAASLTVPSTAKEWIAVFSYETNIAVWVNTLGATAAVPAGATLAATGSQLNPPALTVYAGDTISVICATAATDVGIALYAVSYS